MAKKKKSSKKKESRGSRAERSPFWAQAGAIFLMLVAVFLLLGGFGTGGPLPVNLFHGAYWTFGWVAYLTPVALVYWGVHKFKAEDRQIPLSKFSGMLAVLLFASALGLYGTLPPKTQRAIGAAVTAARSAEWSATWY